MAIGALSKTDVFRQRNAEVVGHDRVVGVEGVSSAHAANTIFLQGTAPLYVLLLAPWLLRERIRGRDLAYMSGLAAGLLLAIWGCQGPLQKVEKSFPS